MRIVFLCVASVMMNVFVNRDIVHARVGQENEMAVVWVREEIWVKAVFSSE